MYLSKVTRISVVSLPRNVSLTKCASIDICTLTSQSWCEGVRRDFMLTISRAPLSTPHRMLENHSSSWARPSSGNSTKSAKGFSSKRSEKDLLSAVQFVTVGVTLRKILKPTLVAVSDHSASRGVTNLRDHVCCLSKVPALSETGFGKKVLDESDADVVAHLLELLVDLCVVVLEVDT